MREVFAWVGVVPGRVPLEEPVDEGHARASKSLLRGAARLAPQSTLRQEPNAVASKLLDDAKVEGVEHVRGQAAARCDASSQVEQGVAVPS